MKLKPFLSGIVFCAVLICAQSLLAAEMISIKGNNVNMRAQPGTSKQVLWTISQGFPLEVKKKSKGWYLVRDFEGSEGWVSETVVSKDRYVVVRVNKGSDRTINVRSTPNTRGAVVANALYGVVFRVVDQKDGWVQVRHSNGVKGWIRKDLLWGL